MNSSRQIRSALGGVIQFEDLQRVADQHIKQFGTEAADVEDQQLR
jgi:hypothetical protein